MHGSIQAPLRQGTSVLKSDSTTELRHAPDQLFPLTRHLSHRLTPALLRARFTPNTITWLSLFAGLAGGACFAAGPRDWGVAGALLLVAAYVLDNCDGEVARIRNMSSAFGAKLDDVADWLIDGFFFAALGYGVASARQEPVWLWLGLAASAGATIDYVVDYFKDRAETPDAEEAGRLREEQARNPRKPEDSLDWVVYIFHKLSRADFCIIVLVLALFDFTWILLPLGAAGAQAYWVADLFSRVRGWHT
ncbi:MAG: CDP-alcohol phosphatidyltransferase family protein [Chromatiales bacterium]|jgi:1L-myo-inositol 1-phosphate cytidylyltransferase / CDP-L-myo-inositol myo-inositolphosphotransferase|nr:CDP-alcohol phosphatidyltransferase family protein [Chromatiales bacterium]